MTLATSAPIVPLFVLCVFTLITGFLLGLFAALVYVEAFRVELREARDDADATRELLGLSERRVASLQGQLRELWRVSQAARGLPTDVMKHSFKPVRGAVTPTYRAWLACKDCGGNGRERL